MTVNRKIESTISSYIYIYICTNKGAHNGTRVFVKTKPHLLITSLDYKPAMIVTKHLRPPNFGYTKTYKNGYIPFTSHVLFGHGFY